MGKDTLMVDQEQLWVYKVKEDGITSASASLGLIFLWDPANGVNYINEYLDLADGVAKKGACIAFGLFNSGILDESDPAKAILEERINAKEYFSPFLFSSPLLASFLLKELSSDLAWPMLALKERFFLNAILFDLYFLGSHTKPSAVCRRQRLLY